MAREYAMYVVLRVPESAIGPGMHLTLPPEGAPIEAAAINWETLAQMFRDEETR